MAREKAATIVVFLEDGSPESHDLASDKDWSLIFEDVLEVKGTDTTTYYPLDAVRKWTVHAHARMASPAGKTPTPGLGLVRRGAKDESKARS